MGDCMVVNCTACAAMLRDANGIDYHPDRSGQDRDRDWIARNLGDVPHRTPRTWPELAQASGLPSGEAASAAWQEGQGYAASVMLRD